MMEKISLIVHSAIRIKSNDGKIIYFDPFRLEDNYKNDADYIFITHSHWDHFSPEDILKIKKDTTKIISPNDIEEKIRKLGFNQKDILYVIPNEDYLIDDINFSTMPAYNLDKDFHKKEYNWVGYIINIDNKKMYIAGDTDNIPEAKNIKCDIAFLPVGGTYTMTFKEAADLVKAIKPEIAIPIHYKSVVGTLEDAYNFKDLLKDIVDVKILMK